MKPRLLDEIAPVASPAPRWPGDHIPRRDWVRTWSVVALNSFGGPAGQIAVMHDELVIRRRWVGEQRFLHALNYCMLLPGPEAQQLATYLGWLLRGPVGGLFAGAMFILPGFLSIMALSIAFAVYGDVSWVGGLFFGIQAAVLAIVASAVVRIGRRVIRNRIMLAVAASAFVAVFVLQISFPVVVAAAIVVGLAGARRPDLFVLVDGHQAVGEQTEKPLVADAEVHLGQPTLARSLRVLGVGLLLWFGPVLVLLATRGPGDVFVDVSLFFSSAAVLTFGGAYSVLAYIAQEAVNTYAWLQPGEMLSGLGMAETTPGPLIQVVQFVGFMGPFREPGTLTPLQAGVAGAVVATWVTFVPSFLWIFLGAPFMERLRGNRALTAALTTVTAAVVGVVLNLAVWFGVYTLFGSVDQRRYGPALVYVPDLATLDVPALLVATTAAIAVFRYRVATLRVVLAAAVAGIVLQPLVT